MPAVRLLLAVLLIGGSIVLAASEIYELVRTGSCGATGAAIAYRECPPGTGTSILLLIASIFVLPFVGMAIAPVNRVGLGGLWWCFLWIAMGAAAMVAGYGPAALPGAKSDAAGVGITFLAIGGLSLLAAIGVALSARSGRTRLEGRLAAGAAGAGGTARRPPPPPPAPAPPRKPTPRPPAAPRAPKRPDVATRLAKLDELHAAGLITQAERDQRRDEILDEV